MAEEAKVSQTILPYHSRPEKPPILPAVRRMLGCAARSTRGAFPLGQGNGIFDKSGDETATVVRALADGPLGQRVRDKGRKKAHAEYRNLCGRSVLTCLAAGT